MRAYHIAMFLIIFNLSLPLLNGLGIFRPIAPQDVPLQSSDPENIVTIILVGSGMLSAVAGVIFRVNIGAIVFSIVFALSALPLAGTINSVAAPFMADASVAETVTAATTMLSGVLAFVFIYAFIQLAGVPTGD